MRPAGLPQALFHGVPVDIREESLDVFRAVRRFIVQQVRMLPDVQHEHWIEACYVANLMLTDPVVR
jgi:hypothetical protein